VVIVEARPEADDNQSPERHAEDMIALTPHHPDVSRTLLLAAGGGGRAAAWIVGWLLVLALIVAAAVHPSRRRGRRSLFSGSPGALR